MRAPALAVCATVFTLGCGSGMEGRSSPARACTAGVAVGRVVRLGAVWPSAVVSEHDPRWQRADLQLECGACVGLVEVYFASSTDAAWWASPKLSVDQHDAFLLGPAPDAAGLPTGAVVVEALEDSIPSCR